MAERKCLRCQEVKTINSRGMCRPCYDAVRKDGTVDQYARATEKDEPAWRSHTFEESSGCWVTPTRLRDADLRDSWSEWSGKPVPYGRLIRNNKRYCRNLWQCCNPRHLSVMTEYETTVFA